MRKVLFQLEECLDLDENFNYEPMTLADIVKIPVLSAEFSKKEIAYSIYMLSAAELIVHEFPQYQGSEAVCKYSENRVISITYKGHEFLEKIRSETIWSKTKENLKPIGAMTIEIISQVASNVITQMIVSQELH